MRWLSRMVHTAQQLIWPDRMVCLLCDERSCGQYLCEQCLAELKRCRLEGQTGAIRSAYRHRECPQRLVLALKFGPIADAAAVLSEAMADEARQMELPPDTVVTWVTPYDRRRRARGVDHGRLLCEKTAERLGMPARKLLTRARVVRTQRGLKAQQRQKNVKGVFVCREPVNVPVLVIDDVLTTGATVGECACALTAAGAPAVYVVTATRASRL